MKLALRLFALFAFLSILPGARAAEPSGTWKGAFDFQGSSVPLTINLKTDGNTVTGTVEGLPTTPAEIHDGTLAGDTVSFWINTDYQGQTYKIVYKGKVAADQISFDFGTEDGSFSAPLMVKKSGPDTAAAPPPPAPDVNGNWKGNFDLNGTPTELIFHLKSAGNAVTGSIERTGAPPTEVHEGKLEGDTVSFWIEAEYQGQSFTIVYKGKVTPGQIDFDFGTADQSWSASVTAKKADDGTPAVQPAPAPAAPAAAPSH
jgi:riboflavin synthase alpha subunit